MITDIKITQRYTNSGHHIARATKLCTVAPNMYASSVGVLRHAVIQLSRILRCTNGYLKKIIHHLCYKIFKINSEESVVDDLNIINLARQKKIPKCFFY